MTQSQFCKEHTVVVFFANCAVLQTELAILHPTHSGRGKKKGEKMGGGGGGGVMMLKQWQWLSKRDNR